MGILLRLIGGFWGALAVILPSLIGRILLALGISFVTYTGFSVTINFMYTSIQSYMGSMPTGILNLLGYLWVDKAIGALFSAYTAALAIKTASSGVVKRMVTK